MDWYCTQIPCQPAHRSALQRCINGHYLCCTGSRLYYLVQKTKKQEVSTDEPFEFDFSDELRVWFQMTRPEPSEVNLCIRVYEEGSLRAEENIRERIHSPEEIRALLEKQGLRVLRCGNRLLDEDAPGTTWYIIAGK